MRNVARPLAAALVCAATLAFPNAAASGVDTQLIARINELRAQGVRCPTASRPPVAAVTIDAKLALTAAKQSQYMAATGRITHTGADGSSPRVRAASSGVNAVSVSEIIYLGVNGPTEKAVQWWLNSAVHCLVITDPRYTHAGASVLKGPRGNAHVIVFSSNPR